MKDRPEKMWGHEVSLIEKRELLITENLLLFDLCVPFY